MKIIIGSVVIVLWASVAGAQAPFPGAVQLHGGWVPCTHPTAIAAGFGCTGTPSEVIPRAVVTPLEVGRYYRQSSGCEFRVLAIARTWQHRRPMYVLETISGRWGPCPEAVYYFDVERPPMPGWVDITETIPAELR